MGIKENVERIEERIQRACLQSGRKRQEVQLMAVTKYIDPPRIQEAVDAGIALVGENHAQQVREKLNFYKQQGLSLHFIGQLQSNKIKYLYHGVECIQSVDRMSLLEALEAYGQKEKRSLNVLLQVNVGREEQKGGALAEELPYLLDGLCRCQWLCMKGFMTVPPAVEEQEARRYFGSLYTIRERYQREYPQLDMSILSMGMSHDFEGAIQEGSNIVRIGSAIFGPRNRM